MLIVTANGAYLDNTGQTAALVDLEAARAWWLAYRKPTKAPGVLLGDLEFIWVADDSWEAHRVYETGGRVVVSGGALSFIDPPSPLPDLDLLYEQLGILKNRKDGQILAGDTGAADQTQSEIDAALVGIDAAKAIIAAAQP